MEKLLKQNKCQQCVVEYFMIWLFYITLKFENFTFYISIEYTQKVILYIICNIYYIIYNQIVIIFSYILKVSMFLL